MFQINESKQIMGKYMNCVKLKGGYAMWYIQMYKDLDQPVHWSRLFIAIYVHTIWLPCQMYITKITDIAANA